MCYSFRDMSTGCVFGRNLTLLVPEVPYSRNIFP